MTPVFCIDIQMSLITIIGPTPEGLLDHFIAFFQKHHNLSQPATLAYKQLKKKLNDEIKEAQTPIDLFHKIIREIFPKHSKEISHEKIISTFSQWTSTKHADLKIILEKEGIESQFSLLEKNYKIVFFIPTKDKIQKAMYGLFLDMILPGRTVHNYSDELFLEAIKQVPVDDLYILSIRARKLKEKILKLANIENKFRFPTNFIFFTNMCLDVETQLYYDDQIIELGIIWDTFTLKFIYTRMDIINLVKDKLVNISDLVFVHLFNSDVYIKRGIQYNLFNEFCPFVFSYFNPLSKRALRSKKTIDYVRWGYFTTKMKKKNCDMAIKYLNSLSPSNAIADVIGRNQLKYYMQRFEMQSFLNSVCESKILIDRLKMAYPEAKLVPIKTISTFSKQFLEVILIDQKINHKQQIEVSFIYQKNRYFLFGR